jgi:hypothetical protein
VLHTRPQLSTLNRILENIECNPLVETYRKVPRANAKFAQTLGQFTVAPLLALGFQDDGTFLSLTPSEDKWPKLVMGRKLVQAARKRRAAALLASLGAASADQAIAMSGLDRGDQWLAQVARDLFS